MINEVSKTNSVILFRKVIFIDQAIEEREITSDRQRLMIQACQVIIDIRMAKYRLDYEGYVKFGVLSSLAFIESQPFYGERDQALIAFFAR